MGVVSFCIICVCEKSQKHVICVCLTLVSRFLYFIHEYYIHIVKHLIHHAGSLCDAIQSDPLPLCAVAISDVSFAAAADTCVDPSLRHSLTPSSLRRSEDASVAVDVAVVVVVVVGMTNVVPSAVF